jgi:outer membrane protein assembly factor BamB
VATGRTKRACAVGAMTVIVAVGAPPVLLTAARAAGPTCAGSSSGGEWRQYSHDLNNSRFQGDEHDLGPAAAKTLAPAWTFLVSANGGTGSMNNTPAVADGCLFVATDASSFTATDGGSVFALNADTGQVVWKQQLKDPVASSPTVKDGRVFLSVNRSDTPYAVALDEHTGALLWSTTIDTQKGSDTFSSPVVFDHMVFVGVSGSGAEAGTTATGNPGIRLTFRGSYSLLDESTGATLVHNFVISDDDFKKGFAGGGVWSTAAVDLATRDAYVGTGNPFNADEHPNTNAIIKIDVDRRRPTFGQLLGTYHGTNDLYVPGGTHKPACAVYVDVFTCDPPDFDMGASPQLFTDTAGRRLVGDHQKSGVYHAADRDTMQGVWKTTVGGPFGQFGGEATASFDGTSIFVAGNAPGLMSALRPTGGGDRWVQPIADGLHFQSVSSADGVTYATDTRGLLDAWDSTTGVPLLVRSLGADTGQGEAQGFSTGWGIAIARHHVYVPTSGGYLVMYRGV